MGMLRRLQEKKTGEQERDGRHAREIEQKTNMRGKLRHGHDASGGGGAETRNATRDRSTWRHAKELGRTRKELELRQEISAAGKNNGDRRER